MKKIVCFVVMPVFLCAGGYAQTDWSKVEKKIEENLPEIKVKETVVNVTPDMRFYLPNGSLDLSLKQKFQKTEIDFASKYDFVDNFMGFNLDFLYDISPFSLGINLADKVDFKEVLSNSQYLQRSQSITPNLQYSLSKTSKIRTGLRFETTYTDSLNSQTRLDYGRNIVGEIGVFSDSLEETRIFPRGGTGSVNLMHSFKNFGSDYDYTQAELNFKQIIYIVDKQYLEYQLQLGYPLDSFSKPLTSIYYAGGFRILRGYDFKEFSSNAIIYNTVVYNIPIAKIENEKLFGVPFSMFTWNVAVESAKIGDKSIYDSFNDSKFSISTGISYKIVLLSRFPIRFEFSTAKAFCDRPPLFYFTLSTIYYSFGSGS